VKRTIRKQKQRLGPQASATLAEASPTNKLEETLEFTNLTDFRNSLQNFIPKLRDNEYLRFVLTKHGRPVAVVLSYDAYNLLKRVAERVMDEEDAKEPAAAMQEAYQELTGDTATGRTPIDIPVEVTTARDIHGPELQKTRHLVRMAVQEYIQAMKKRVKDVNEEEKFIARDMEKL
jgi:prevent-host-death family protein